jgi:signal transduction histidine kinase
MPERLRAATTFRGRLLAVSMLVLGLGLAGLLIAGNLVLGARVTADQQRLLRARAQTALAAVDVRDGHVVVRESTGSGLVDPEVWVLDGPRVVSRPAHEDAAVDRAAVVLGRAGRSATAETGDDVGLRADPVVDRGRRIGAVVVSLSAEPVERVRREVVLGSVVLAGLVLVAGWYAIRNAVDGALRPVAAMTDDAAAWSANDLDRRFDLGPPRDELTALAATLDGMLARIAASRRHEQRFAAEVAHELRTPIARMRARAELALHAGRGADAERERALESVVTEVDRLTAAIDALLAVARGEGGAGTGSVDVEALAREVDGVAVVAPDGLPPAEGDAEIVRRALAPLVENARRHARARVELVLTASAGRVRVAVRDDGPGIPLELGEQAFEPGVRGPGAADSGAGLGLPLARRLARSCGGDVTLGEDGGVVLELPAIAPLSRGGSPRHVS